jgi:hypothetical protein
VVPLKRIASTSLVMPACAQQNLYKTEIAPSEPRQLPLLRHVSGVARDVPVRRLTAASQRATG